MRLVLCSLLAATSALAASVEGGLPIFFVENPGEVIRFIAETPRFRAGFGQDFVVFHLHDQQIRLRFAGANPAAGLSGLERQPGQANFLLGGRAAASLATYKGLVYRNLYKGIDARYGVDRNGLKSEFLVAPSADPGRIRFEYGDAALFVDENGELVVTTQNAELREHVPIAYQETADGRRIEVRVRYRVLANGVGFELGEYDPELPLVIDPSISYSTFLGGSGMGAVTGVAVDSSGNLYATGWTEAIDFPIGGAAQAANRGGVDAFVVKLNPAGNTILYATYFGGSAEDRAAGIAVDALGQAHVAGSTGSSNFPVVNAFDGTFSGSRDAFVLKLNVTGNMALYSTFLGGSGYDAAMAIALDTAGNAYVTGDTQSANFPHPGGPQATLGGKTDAFVAKLSSAGALTYGTYVGGSNDEHSSSIAVTAAGNIYIGGWTTSINFPVVSALQVSLAGGQDGFITELNTAGSALQFSSYWGGSGGAPGSPEQINGIALDSTGAIYLVGTTSSSNFPVSSGAFQGNYSGAIDAFLTKLAANGASVVYSTFLGGNGFDWASAVVVDAARFAHVAGYTASPSFVSVGALQAGFKGLYDAFIAKFNQAGNAISFGSLYGGTGADAANAVAIDATGNIYLGGQTGSFDLALTGAIQSTNLGNSTGWVARIQGSSSAPPPVSPSTVSVSPASGSGNTVTFAAAFSHSAAATNLTTVAVLVNNSASLDFGCYVTYNRAANQLTLANDTVSSGGQTVTPGGNNVQNTQCSLNGSTSSVSISGTNLTLNVSLTFFAAFTGTKTVYLYAADSNTNTGLVSRGSWTVTLGVPVPTADSVSPSGGAGSAQTFSLVFSDTQNATNLTSMGVLFQTTVSFANACNVIYDRAAQSIALVGDTGSTSTTKLIGSATVLQNSQCSVGATSALQSGLSIILSVAITFKTSFSGAKNIYMFAAEGPTDTGWVQRGTFQVALGGAPVADSVVPAFGSGPGQRFSFTVSDTGGGAFVTGVAMLFSTTLSSLNACSLVYDRAANTIALAYDNPANGQAPVVPGSSTSVSNSQCTLRGPNSTVVTTLNSVVVTVDLLFNANFFGSKSVFLLAAESGTNSGWRAVGNWVVTGGAPTADSISPSSGTSRTPSFTLAVSDSTNQQNIIGMSLIMTTGSPSNIANACYVVFNRVNSTIGLYSDDGTTLGTKGIGSAATLQNSQCAIGYTVVAVAGNSVLLTVNLVLSPAFAGTKSVYLMATEPDTNSGWVLRGIWTVP